MAPIAIMLHKMRYIISNCFLGEMKMARGKSDRVVIDIDPKFLLNFKRALRYPSEMAGKNI